MATAAAAFSLKLFIDIRTRRVLFAEASRDAVGFLHSLLVAHLDSLPFEDASRHGCTPNIYDSFDELAAHADTCCCHRCSPPPPGQQAEEATERFFVCGDKRGTGCGEYVTDRSGATCPSCGARMVAEVPRGAPGAGGSEQQGAAAGALVCMLKDDLTVVPATGTFLALAGNIMRGVVTAALQEAAAFQVATVPLGHNEGLKILEASLRSSTVLTDVFLRDKAVALEFDPSPPSLDHGWL